ncbi:hypothetical protein HanXRQr2_Chr02g0077371 [Helianthus annuus]|uniref:Uncharacterized protein n=1 Tax=Helianthus annuus TaxID=4232 RepID=A0A9K3JPL8_HELAN|nr:hypothetical protein HanXRQr2_Chr02g0077371 [Helianthus annuus]
MVIWSIEDEDAFVRKSKSTVCINYEKRKFHGVRLLQKLMDSVLLFQVCPLCISITA